MVVAESRGIPLPIGAALETAVEQHDRVPAAVVLVVGLDTGGIDVGHDRSGLVGVRCRLSAELGSVDLEDLDPAAAKLGELGREVVHPPRGLGLVVGGAGGAGR
jgi:hypothetical protein